MSILGKKDGNCHEEPPCYHMIIRLLGVKGHRQHRKWLYFVETRSLMRFWRQWMMTLRLKMHCEVDWKEWGPCCTVQSGDMRERISLGTQGFCHFGAQETQEWRKVTLVSVGWPESHWAYLELAAS